MNGKALVIAKVSQAYEQAVGSGTVAVIALITPP
jgi:hypothetical protein